MASRDLSGDRNATEALKVINEVDKRRELAQHVKRLPRKVSKQIKTVPRFDKN